MRFPIEVHWYDRLFWLSNLFMRFREKVLKAYKRAVTFQSLYEILIELGFFSFYKFTFQSLYEILPQAVIHTRTSLLSNLFMRFWLYHSLRLFQSHPFQSLYEIRYLSGSILYCVLAFQSLYEIHGGQADYDIPWSHFPISL